MYDALNILQTLVTKTASFGGTGYDLKTGTPRRGMKARFLISSYSGDGNVFTPKIQESEDNTTFYDVGATSPITSTTSAASKLMFVSFETQKRYIRAYMEVAGAASLSPSIAYLCDLGIAKP